MELKRIFPRDTAAHIAALARRDVSVVEKWLQGKVEPSGQAIVELMNSEQGEAVIAAAIRSCPYPWRRRRELGDRYAAAREKADEARRELALIEQTEVR